MSKLDSYYRAFKEYRKETKNNAELRKERQQFSESNPDLDVLTSTKYIITIETDWIETIEKGLEYVQKAIAEERQFIRVNGEIVPIEKVKKVSKTSVEYLARHANMITHLPEKEGDTLVPDELYITEKLNDYAVYENRFLYMLLRYLEDFIYFRLDKIEKLRSTYIGNFTVSKEVKSGKRELKFETKLYEKRDDNPYPIADSETDKVINRIRDCYAIVSALLTTPLMQEVSKAPMLKPPITKTNVLKMNNNFKNSLALYEYVSMYNTLGFSSEEVVKEYMPFSDQNADELFDSLALTSFLTYKIGNDIEDILETEYEIDERKRKEEEERKLDERIKRLKKRALESNKSLEEYMLILETRNQQLLHDAEQLAIARNEIELLNKTIDGLNLEKLELNRRIDKLNEIIEEKVKEIAYLNQKYIDDMAALKKAHALEIDELNRIHDEELAEMETRHEVEIGELNAQHDEQVRALEEDHKLNIANLKSKYSSIIANKEAEYENERTTLTNTYEAEITRLTAENKAAIDKAQKEIEQLSTDLANVTTNRKQKIKEFEEEIKNLKINYQAMLDGKDDEYKSLENKYNDLEDTKNLYMGELSAMRIKEGMMVPCDDFASKERFEELVKEYESMEKFMNRQWKLTKKRIRKEVMEEAQAKEEEENKKKQAIIDEYEKELKEKAEGKDNDDSDDKHAVDIKPKNEDDFDDFMKEDEENTPEAPSNSDSKEDDSTEPPKENTNDEFFDEEFEDNFKDDDQSSNNTEDQSYTEPNFEDENVDSSYNEENNDESTFSSNNPKKQSSENNDDDEFFDDSDM